MSSYSLRQVTTYKPLSQCSMEELAAHEWGPNASGGTLFARHHDGGEGKRAARQQIVDLFHPDTWPGRLNMLTMPGLNWRFERMMLGWREPGWSRRLGEHRRTYFMGVESDRLIYYGGLTQIPGLFKNAPLKPVTRQKDYYRFAELAFKTRYATFFFANMDDILTYDWGYGRGWDAAWLDYTGPMTVERLTKIQGFYNNHIRSTLIVTSLKARWNKRTSAAIEKAGGHSEWLRQNLDGHVLHDLEYFDTSPMAQFAVSKKAVSVALPSEMAA